MSVEQQIDRHLENSNFAAAFALYEDNSQTLLSYTTLVKLARAYYVQQEYERCLGVLAKTAPDNLPAAYELTVLQFKCSYLCKMACETILEEFRRTVGKECFKSHHRAVYAQFTQIMGYRSERKSLQERITQGKAFADIYRNDEARGAFSFEGFPIFVIAKRWFDIWRSYVFLDGSDPQTDGSGDERPHPGTITQFELLDHPFNVLHDSEKQKDYTNRFLFEGVEYELLTKECWNFLKKRYSGIPISRLNISLYEKPTEIVTEVHLKKLLIGRANAPQEKYWAQICRKETWEALIRKLEQTLGKGVLWKSAANRSRNPINLKGIIQDEDLSKVELIYEQGAKPPQTPIADLKSSSAGSGYACAACGKTDKLSFCSCRMVKYCNKQCLEAHRSKHRKLCESKKQQEHEVSGLIRKFNLGTEETYANRKGLVGLRNLGNTCYMNSGLQCISNTRELTDYFMTNRFLADINSTNPLGSNGYIACCYSKLIREIWSGKETDVSPWELKRGISSFAPQFAGYNQHDSQELISTLLDALHQDTNLVKVKQPAEIEDDDRRTDEEGSALAYELYAKRNKSFISSLTLGQFKSTAKCPCGRVSKSFDPFMMVSLPVPQSQTVYVYFLARNCPDLPLRYTVALSGNDTVEDVAERIRQNKRVRQGCIKLYALDNKFKITHEFRPDERADSLKNYSIVFAYEIDYISSEEMVRIEYFMEDRGQQKPSYPRLLIVPRRSLTRENVLALVMKDLKKYCKDTPPADNLDISFENSNIRVVIRSKMEMQLQNFVSHRQTLESRRAGCQLDISDCLTLFQKEELLDKENSWYCNKCKQFVQAFKQIQIYRANRILMLGFKRFRLGRKLNWRINFPVNGLNMGPYIIGNQENKPMLYDLYAVANHYGTMLGGHYTAFCRNFLDRNWYEFNDERVSRVRQDQIVSSSAYVLFYRLRD